MSHQSNRAFGLTIATVMAIIWSMAYFVFASFLIWPVVTAGVFVLVALAVPSVLLPLNRLWVLALGAVGHINNRIVLGVFFYSVFMPIGFLMRLFGKDPMHKSPQPAITSYFTPVGRQANADTYRDMF